MKICYISHGSFIHTKPYLDFFSNAGHEVCLLKLAPGPDYGIETYDLSLGSNYNSAISKIKYIISSIKARKLIREINPTIVHAHFATSGGLAGLVAGFHPTVVTVHGSDLTTRKDSRVWRPILKKIFKKADSLNVVSPDLKAMAKELGVNESKIDVLTLGVDTELFSFKQRIAYDSAKPLRLVNTRRLEHVYDHPTILKAIEFLKKQGVNLKMTFVGYGELEEQLVNQAKQIGIDKDIIFVGGCDNSDMPSYLYDNDIYLSASLWDGTSLCLLEAMATGIFPIVSDIPANSTWIKDGQTGFLHRVGDPKHLADLVTQYVTKSELAVKAGTENRSFVIEHGDRKTNMEKLESIYKKLSVDDEVS